MLVYDANMNANTHFLDVSVSHFTSNYTRMAHHFSVDTQILLKVPAEKLTTVRLKGNLSTIPEFLRSLIGKPGFENWAEGLVRMHSKAIKKLTPDSEAPAHKNRWISEQRERSL